MRDILTAVREGRLDPASAGQLLEDPALDDAALDDAAARTDRSPPAAATDQFERHVPEPEVSEPEVSEPGVAEPPVADHRDTDHRDTDHRDTDHRDTDHRDSDRHEPAAASPGVWATVTDDPVTPSRAGADTAERPSRSATAGGEVDTEGRTTTSLRLRAMTRRVRVLGDPTVQTVSVDGPHELRREGSVLVLESDRDFPFGDPFAFVPTVRGGFRLQPPQGLPFSFGSELVVRLNPAIDLDVDVTAGSLSVRDVGRVRARVTAGSARIEGVRGPLDVHVVGGTARVDATIRGGDNRIRCDSGSLVVRLRSDSDVRLRPDAQLGRIVIDGAEGGREIVVGAGAGRLDVEVVMGSLQVEVQR